MAILRSTLQIPKSLPRPRSPNVAMHSPRLPSVFLPPTNRSMRDLDRSFFQKIIPIAAATVFDDRNISAVRGEIQRAGNSLGVSSLKAIVVDETVPGGRKYPKTWSPTIAELVEKKLVGIRPYDLKLTYEDWSMHNILDATLPEFEEDDKETPAGFSLVGHVAHLNLREQYLPYKHLIGQVLLDKNPNVRTVINKTEDVGSTNPYRTFRYEVLAGPDDMDVTVSFSGCDFRFNFAKVYWNPRLHTEHERLISRFREGEAVCDVMAGVGPFAVPSGKKRVFVSANDLNPDSNAGLNYAIKKNKVEDFVTADCMDGREFIRRATKELAGRDTMVIVPQRTMMPRQRQRRSKSPPWKASVRVLKAPKTFQHYVMNLPASAVEFLDAFKGTYAGRSKEFTPYTETKLPMVHVYCFSEQKETEEGDRVAVCELVSKHLGHRILPSTPDTEIHFVRKVSPKKCMFCASFRLPPEIAFAE
ncbi:hypothetical protein EPUS_05664 [Endocarpon pusillum Z07020]|uniref:tRNA (guanine(37)-N1)-methyltransferase n=1 Tax=Endocarpon pusillum (strain Z07020 / HMAS-L-300199) TaxID=1263415 RepID=U1HEN3_ENDPU|nr:uncharacterized protein EPUS_05664 [Endocarpon pusillum Z07020]ERF68525.1 hypothetical protein EPUS_05664 [Endocarpon pusillum Z07020]